MKSKETKIFRPTHAGPAATSLCFVCYVVRVLCLLSLVRVLCVLSVVRVLCVLSVVRVLCLLSVVRVLLCAGCGTCA